MLPVLLQTGSSAHGALFHYRDDCPGHCANPNATHVSSGAHCVRMTSMNLHNFVVAYGIQSGTFITDMHV